MVEERAQRASRNPGGDLFLRPGPGIPQGLLIPASELGERFSRSSGPGGQSVNTADSRAELVFDMAASSALSDQQKARVAKALGSAGPIAIAASEHRSQHRNRNAARERLAVLLRAALAPPPMPRVPTKPSRGSQRRRLDTKKQRGRTKSLRGRVRDS
ncbi:MAG: alternative ribosome rescue aminoacyl-tRNA hydrolase ArfB [Marmoricola sp.]